jgi:hypothetical protein
MSEYILEYMLRNERENDRQNAAFIMHAYKSFAEMARVRIDSHHLYGTETKSWAVY